MPVKKSFLLAIFLVTAMVLIFSFALAKSENAKNSNGLAVATSSGNSTSSAVKNQGQINAVQHRSVVANFVQALVHAADREKGGIGEQVRLIAQQQNQSASTTVQAMEKIQKRSRIETFIFGSDYKNLGAMRSEMVQTQNRLEQLVKLMKNVKNEADKTELQNQIMTLEQEQTRIQEFVAAQEGRFSLFGWLMRLFN
ncbi:MAG: hypothetical protein A2Y98_03080 [Candidatus Portnoybacteria bacterium RBG_19FT_COMBO_36_7]|uniref:DUF5667 domain-containing protein n=1 Tax=Candidatus Portnoybacteria bacterium RBG_19FT_COMBO_36_7 TaxID=1801992 RepID=A0A1G2F8S2_9BACT|nr:MAG: hypothetical protein A2Y98_03080 [Candidatus Portnoybacteria bacterium RBG_19FT_COMBO_36_7]